MKINSLENNHNILPRVFSVFPLFISLAALSIWGTNDSLVALTISLLFAYLFFYTFFFTKYEKYIDTETSKIVKRIKWLWINWNEEESLNQYLMLIKTLVAICPMVGLLGTVTGMITVFETMATHGTGNPRLMAAGISMATVPTMAGMVAALSGLFV